MSGRPYSVLQPSFFFAIEGKKAKRIRFFWSMVGVEGKPKSKFETVALSGGGARSGVLKEGIVSFEGLRVCARDGAVGGGGKCRVGVGAGCEVACGRDVQRCVAGMQKSVLRGEAGREEIYLHTENYAI